MDEEVIAYARVVPDRSNLLIAVGNLDPHHAQAGEVELPLEELGIDAARTFQADDLLGGARHLWQGRRKWVALDPQMLPAHVFRVRTERDFDYFP